MEIREFKEFRARDPFNPQNILEGKISHHRNKFYGALKIDKVNNQKVNSKWMLATPKIQHPYGKTNNFYFPSATQILAFRKYDGTNIFMYRYQDAEGNSFTSYKVRTYPFLRPPFIAMWKKILQKYPGIPFLFQDNPTIIGFSFELYGSLNQHFINYDKEVDLDTVLLFGLQEEGQVLPVTELKVIKNLVSKAQLRQKIDQDYVWHYTETINQLDGNLKYIISSAKDEPTYYGEEGEIWYLQDKRTNLWKMYKCKVSELEKIHQQKVPLLTKEVVRATAINILEAHDEVTLELLTEYLLEEFPIYKIQQSLPMIRKQVWKSQQSVTIKKRIRKILDDYEIPVTLSRTEIVKQIHKDFTKRDLRHAYRLLPIIQRERQFGLSATGT